MIANARMYSVTPEVAGLWHELLAAIIAAAGQTTTVIEHSAPDPIDELWQRTDLAGVFMCGLPFSRAEPPPALVAAPVPAPIEFAGEPRYWSEWVVNSNSEFHTVSDTFGGRIAFTVPGSQSGCIAALTDLTSSADQARAPLFQELIAPTITPAGALSAVADGAADIAPVDAYAFSLLRRYRPELTRRVRVIGRTQPAPIPPLVASSRQGLLRLQGAFLEAHHIPASQGLMEKLSLQRFAAPDAASYGELRDRFDATMRFWQSRSLAVVTHLAFTCLTDASA